MSSSVPPDLTSMTLLGELSLEGRAPHRRECCIKFCYVELLSKCKVATDQCPQRLEWLKRNQVDVHQSSNYQRQFFNDAARFVFIRAFQHENHTGTIHLKSKVSNFPVQIGFQRVLDFISSMCANFIRRYAFF